MKRMLVITRPKKIVWGVFVDDHEALVDNPLADRVRLVKGCKAATERLAKQIVAGHSKKRTGSAL